MAATRQLFGLAWRESRTARRRLLLYMSSISLGVAALVAIDSFSDNVIRSVHEQSRALLGGDVMSTRQAPRTKAIDSLLDSLSRRGVAFTTATNFSSMALVPRTGGTRLVQVHAVSPAYPFYGNIITAPAAAWGGLQQGHNVIVDPSLLVSLDGQIGDTISLGNAKFVVTGTLKSVPGDVGISAAIGPRVYIPERYVDETGLVVFGSRAEYETLFKLPESMSRDLFVSRYSRRMSQGSTGSMRAAGYNESRLASAIDQLHDYLAIVGLVALLLGGIGVASGVHAFAMRKIDPVAILRCLGATSWQVLAIYAVQAAIMGLIGAAAGVVLGIGIQFMFPRVLKDFLPVDVDVRLAPKAMLLGLGIGVWVALLFAMRPLVALRRVSPLQALRRSPDAEALKKARWDPLRITLSFAIVVSVLELGLMRANTVQRGIGFTAAIGGAIGILYLSATLLSWIAQKIAAPVVALSAPPGHREPLPPGQPDARRGARVGLWRVPHGNAVPGAAEHSANPRRAHRPGARECGVLRRAGGAAAGHRFDRARQPHRDDRRDADRADANCVDQRTTGERHPRRSGKSATCRARRTPRRSKPRTTRAVGAAPGIPLDLPGFADRIGEYRGGALVLRSTRRQPGRSIARHERRG